MIIILSCGSIGHIGQVIVKEHCTKYSDCGNLKYVMHAASRIFDSDLLKIVMAATLVWQLKKNFQTVKLK